MSLKIDHLSYRVTTKPNPNSKKWGNTEFVYLNLVFSLSKDDDFYEAFLNKTKDYTAQRIILDTELYEKELESAFKPFFDSMMSDDVEEEEFQGEKFIKPKQPDYSLMTESNEVMGYSHQSTFIQHLEKFDKFRFHEYFYWCNTVQGAIQDIRNLQQGVNLTRTTDECFLYDILSGLEYLWD